MRPFAYSHAPFVYSRTHFVLAYPLCILAPFMYSHAFYFLACPLCTWRPLRIECPLCTRALNILARPLWTHMSFRYSRVLYLQTRPWCTRAPFESSRTFYVLEHPLYSRVPLFSLFLRVKRLPRGKIISQCSPADRQSCGYLLRDFFGKQSA